MGDSEDEDVIGFDPVDQVVRKSADAAFPRLVQNNRSGSGMFPGPLKGAFDFVEEDFAQAGYFAFIEAGALEKLSPCQRMPGDPSHFSRERASRRTSSEGMGVTSPLSISL